LLYYWDDFFNDTFNGCFFIVSGNNDRETGQVCILYLI
jgi:hypothetical protein